MKQPTIMYNGEKLKVSRVSWYDDGRISHICFHDGDGKFHVAHGKGPYDTEGYDNSGNLNMDLEKAMAHNAGGVGDE